MFKTIKRIIEWCSEFRGKLYIGFVFSFLSSWFAAMPVMAAAYTISRLVEAKKQGSPFDERWIGLSVVGILLLIFLRFLFDYLRARFQETISYELVARDRLAIGDALKRVSLGYFQKLDTGNILNSITTGLSALEAMGIRVLDTCIGGYLNYFCIFLFLLLVNWKIALITLSGILLSFFSLLLVSHYSRKNAPVSADAAKDLTGAAIEFARGLAVVKSFGKESTALDSMKQACRDNQNINVKVELGFVPGNCLHLLALKLTGLAVVGAACYLMLAGQIGYMYFFAFCFLSFIIFSGVEPISDSAHILGVINTAFEELYVLRQENYIDSDGKEISLDHFDICFENVGFGYENENVLEHVSFQIPERTSTAIVGPSGSGKTTICNLLARFYDVKEGSITLGGHDVREFTCDSLLSYMSMVFQNVYLFNDTVRANICFGKPDATEAEMIAAAKKARCHDFIIALPSGYDTVVGEGGGLLSGGEKQRISIARAILKDAPIIILDEATASIDPENEHLIQAAISELTRGKTIITIAHRLATIENADQILVVDHGTIAQKGTHEELIAQEGRYKRFIEVRREAEGWKLK